MKTHEARDAHRVPQSLEGRGLCEFFVWARRPGLARVVVVRSQAKSGVSVTNRSLPTSLRSPRRPPRGTGHKHILVCSSSACDVGGGVRLERAY